MSKVYIELNGVSYEQTLTDKDETIQAHRYQEKLKGLNKSILIKHEMGPTYIIEQYKQLVNHIIAESQKIAKESNPRLPWTLPNILLSNTITQTGDYSIMIEIVPPQIGSNKPYSDIKQVTCSECGNRVHVGNAKSTEELQSLGIKESVIVKKGFREWYCHVCIHKWEGKEVTVLAPNTAILPSKGINGGIHRTGVRHKSSSVKGKNKLTKAEQSQKDFIYTMLKNNGKDVVFLENMSPADFRIFYKELQEG